MTHELVVPAGVANRRLDVYLGEQPAWSRSQAQRLIKDQCVSVNGRLERSSYPVNAGDVIVVREPEAVVHDMPVPKLPVVYEDETMLVIDKPAGINVHGGAGIRPESTVADFARTVSTDPDPERPGIVHRLDRDTSGLLVIAKTAAAKQQLQDQWRSRAVKKTYLLLASGHVTPTEAVIKMGIERDPSNPLRRHVSSSGKPAVTRYRVLEDLPGYSYIEARPETGRTHQLRVHFAAMGHPIAADAVYGQPARGLKLKRQFLHASSLELTSPAGDAVSITSPLPSDLEAVLQSLRKEL